MKKFAIAIMAFVAMTAQAANFVQVEQEHVTGRSGASDSEATYLRAGKDIGNYSLGFQSRTARFTDGSIANSFESTVSNKNISAFGITPFVGVGRDFSGAYTYGLVGANAGVKVGPGFALAGVKTRVGSTQDGDRTKQTVTYVSYAVPVAKDVSVSIGASRSSQDIKEDGVGIGVSFSF